MRNVNVTRAVKRKYNPETTRRAPYRLATWTLTLNCESNLIQRWLISIPEISIYQQFVEADAISILEISIYQRYIEADSISIRIYQYINDSVKSTFNISSSSIKHRENRIQTLNIEKIEFKHLKQMISRSNIIRKNFEVQHQTQKILKSKIKNWAYRGR